MPERPAVVLVHGLWMVGAEMLSLRRRLAAHGFAPYLFHYHSILNAPRSNAARLAAFVRAIPADLVHYVGHSLGGLLIRQMLYSHPEPRPGRVVTLGTPHRGSRTAVALSRSAGMRLLLGRARDALLGGVPSWPGDRSLGSIAGTRAIGMGQLFGRFDGPNDGTVAVDETLLANADHLLVHASHMELPLSRAVADATCTYLETGRFG